MTHPNTLIFVDWPASDPHAAGEFYAAVFGWEHDPRMNGAFSRMVPGGMFPNPDGSASEIKNLHMGIFAPDDPRPHPQVPAPAMTPLSDESARARIYILVSPDDSVERILSEAEARGATMLWRDHYWKEFNGYCHAFRDPWGTQIVLWVKAGEAPDLPAHYTREED